MTPDYLAREIVDYFPIRGKVLEPCRGEGAFYDLLSVRSNIDSVDWCELSAGVDFLEYTEKVDWIVTNPPWSKFRPFLVHSMKLATDVVFLITINHLWTKARLRDIREHGFSIAEIKLCDYPKEWPSSGFQLGAIHITSRETEDKIKLSW